MLLSKYLLAVICALSLLRCNLDRPPNRTPTLPPPTPPPGGVHGDKRTWVGSLSVSKKKYWRELLRSHNVCDIGWLSFGDASCKRWDDFPPRLTLQVSGNTLPADIYVMFVAQFRGILHFTHNPTGQGVFTLSGKAKSYNDEDGMYANFSQRFGFGTLVRPVLLRSEDDSINDSELEITLYYGARSNSDNLLGEATLFEDDGTGSRNHRHDGHYPTNR